MTSSWKIGAIAGFIAGIVSGIVYAVFSRISASIGLYSDVYRQSIVDAYGANILMSIFFGVICGIIYSKAYNVIPGERILKAIFFSFILFLISWVRNSVFGLSYGLYLDAAGNVFTAFFHWMAYGLVLGFLFESLISRYYPIQKEAKIVTYDLMGGILPGAIAGFLGGFGAAIANYISSVTGLFAQAMPGAPRQFSFSFWLSQSGSHIMINLFWGAIFGIIFTKVYNVVPGKGVIRSLCYSMILLLLGTFLTSMHWVGWGFAPLAEWAFFVGFLQASIFGIVLGLLYRKPSE